MLWETVPDKSVGGKSLKHDGYMILLWQQLVRECMNQMRNVRNSKKEASVTVRV